MSNKLHELLAVEQDRKQKANQSIDEAVNTFTQKEFYLDGMVKRYLSMEENGEQVPDERKEIVITAKDKISQVLEAVIQGVDANLSKEETNASSLAKADLVVDGVNFGTFAATSLLALETHVTKIKTLYKSIPVLDLTRKWTFDEQRAVYKTDEEIKFRTIKRAKVIVKYEATKEHPAQTELLNIDEQVGKYETVYFSGRISVAQKGVLLQRIDTLLEAIKVARAQANTVEVKNTKLAKKLFDFINNGVF